VPINPISAITAKMPISTRRLLPGSSVMGTGWHPAPILADGTRLSGSQRTTAEIRVYWNDPVP
jgi:hypothetical protein